MDRSLLEGICSPEKVGSQAITLAGNGVRADTQLVTGGGPRTTQARHSHHGVFCRITTTSRSWALSRHPPSPPVLGSILGGFGWSFPKLILSQRCCAAERMGTHNQCWLRVAFRLNTHTNVDRCTGTLSITALPRHYLWLHFHQTLLKSGGESPARSAESQTLWAGGCGGMD